MIQHSFAVMAYKDSLYLSECLDSLKAQTMESEIYITTSTPSDFITDIAKKYDVELFVTQTGLGIAHDWTFSLQQSKTKYVTLAHQDDLYLPDYTKKCISASEKFLDTLICFTGYAEIIGNSIRSNKLLLRVKRFMLWCFMPLNKNIQSKFRRRFLLATGCPIAAPSVMYNLEKLSGFQFSDQFSVNMDWDAWDRISKREGRFVYVNESLLLHRIHPDSATSEGLKNNDRQREDLLMYKRFWPGLLARIFAKMYSGSYTSNSDQAP